MAIALLHGDDKFRINQHIRSLSAGLSEMWAAFNLADTTDGKEAMETARTPVFGEGDRVVIWRNCTLFSKKDEVLFAKLERSIDLMVPNCQFILVADSIDSRLKATKEFKKLGTVLEFKSPSSWDVKAIESLVSDIAKSSGIDIEPSALELLALSIGADSQKIHAELQRLSVLCRGRITDEAVRSTVDRSTQTALELAESLVKGEGMRSLSLLNDLLRLNYHPLQIVATLVNRVRKLWMVNSLKGDKAEVAKLAEVGNPNQLFYLKRDLEKVKTGYLENMLALLLDAEVAIKSGADGAIALELMVEKVVGYASLGVVV